MECFVINSSSEVILLPGLGQRLDINAQFGALRKRTKEKGQKGSPADQLL